MQAKATTGIKRIVDAVLTVLLLLIMAYQVTGDFLHEWLGIGMTVLLIAHHILNRKWYGALFKGKYSAYRITVTAVNTLLLAAIGITAICGMSMSCHAVPFMYGIVNMMTARKWHLAFSYWSFMFMGVHIGLHLKAMTTKLGDKAKICFNVILTVVSGIGLWLFIKNELINYILLKMHFAFLDYQKAKWFVIAENLAMLMFFVLGGNTLACVLQKNKDKKCSLKSFILLSGAMVIGIVLNMAFKDTGKATI